MRELQDTENVKNHHSIIDLIKNFLKTLFISKPASTWENASNKHQVFGNIKNSLISKWSDDLYAKDTYVASNDEMLLMSSLNEIIKCIDNKKTPSI